jgi:hypothetical protein
MGTDCLSGSLRPRPVIERRCDCSMRPQQTWPVIRRPTHGCVCNQLTKAGSAPGRESRLGRWRTM